jgi:hypothetical protein
MGGRRDGEENAKGVANSEGGRCRARQTRENRTHSPECAEGNQTPGEGPSFTRVIGRTRPGRTLKGSQGHERTLAIVQTTIAGAASTGTPEGSVPKGTAAERGAVNQHTATVPTSKTLKATPTPRGDVAER